MAVYCIDTEALEGNKMLDYCDYIADVIHQAAIEAANQPANDRLIDDVNRVQRDLHPTEGWLRSTNKTIDVFDVNGRKYRVTVEAVEE